MRWQWLQRRSGEPPAATRVDSETPEAALEAAAAPARRRWLALGGALLVVPLLLLGGVLFWALGTAAGAQTVLGWVPGLSVTGVRGALAGDFQVDRLRWRLGSQRVLHIDALGWQGLALRWPGGGPPQWQVARLWAERIDLQGPSDDPDPIQLPQSLVLPLAVHIDTVRIDTVLFDAIRPHPVQGLTGQLRLDAGTGARHRLDGLQGRWDRLQADGEATLEAAAPLRLQAALRLKPLAAAGAASSVARQDVAPDWSARLAAQGPLARLQVTALLSGRGQSLDAEAEVEPVAVQPLSRLKARFQALDLAPLASGWPQTALSGHIDATLDAGTPGRAAEPLGIDAGLVNALPGALDARRLPLRRLQLAARGPLNALDHGRIEDLQLSLANGQDAAGEVQAEGRWALIGQGADRRIDLDISARLNALQPARLHQAAPALNIGGPLAVNLSWPLAHAAAGNAEPAAARGIGPPGARLGLQTELRGHLVGAGLPDVRLRVNLDATPQGVDLDSLLAESGAARLEASGQLQREAAGWRIQLDSALQAFDPLPWWPGAAAHPLGRGPHRLAGQARINLLWPERRPVAQPASSAAAAPSALGEGGQAALARLATLRGEARVTLGASLLAGVPFSGQLHLASSQSQPALGPLSHVVADLELQATPAGSAATEVRLHADLDPNHGQDHWSARWSSPELESLAPWWRLIDPAQPPRLAGDTTGQLTLDGRWPRLRSQGELSAGSRQALRWWTGTGPGQESPATAAATAAATTVAPLLQLRGLRVHWQVGSGADDTLQFEAGLDQLQAGDLQVQAVDLQGHGRTAAHNFTGRLDLLRQPAAADSANSTDTTSATTGTPPPPAPATRRFQARWQADGGLSLDLATRRSTWAGRIAQGSVHELIAATGDGQPASSAALLNLAPTSLRLSHSPLTTLFQVDPTRLAVNGAWLRLDELTWREERPLQGGPTAAGSEQRSLTLRAELEPLAIAPLLARAQPGFGWAGDLQVGGRIEVLAMPQRFSANAELQRVQGDLLVVDPDNPAGPQRLGLAGLRLAASARDGQWRLTQHIAGGNLGSLDGQQSLQAPPAAVWPPAQAPLTGRIDLRIAQLGHWGRWLPAGWRLSGQLDTHAALAGTFGGPELSGELVGQGLAVRNVLQGVDWRDASVRIALAGDTASIRQFNVKAGSGQLDATGQVQLGSAPSLIAQIQADHFAALQRVDRRVVVSGQTELRFDARSTTLKGRLGIDEGRFDFTQRDAPGLADDVTVVRSQPEGTPAESGPPAARGLQRNTLLDLRVDLGKQLHLQGRGLSTRLTGELRLTTPNNRLAVHGNVHAEDGTYTAYGQKLGIDRGIILFAGAADNPRLDIEATKPDLEDMRVGVAITGTAQSPRVRLFSDPEMTETDKLSYLLLGRASDGLGRTDLALLQRAAFALITGEDDSPSLIERVGLDELSVRKEDGDTRETVVSLGKQLSRRWYLGYERSLNAATGTWQLIYRVAQRFTLRAQTGTENALDLIWTWKWGTTSLLPIPLPDAPPSAGRAASQPAVRTKP